MNDNVNINNKIFIHYKFVKKKKSFFSLKIID